MPTLAIDGNDLVVRLTGADSAYALRRTVRVPRSAVRSVTVGPQPVRVGVRAPGACIPGVLAVGTWRSRYGRDLWAVHRAPRVVVVELARGSSYRRLIVEVDDPDAAIAALQLPS